MNEIIANQSMDPVSQAVGNSAQPPPHDRSARRSSKYVDFKIQMWMLIGMVCMEVGMVIAAMFYLYWRFSEIIETSLYRIHHSADALFESLLIETGRILAILIGVNLLAIFIADRVWIRYVSTVLDTFRILVHKVADLDFSDDSAHPTRHRVLDKMLVWRRKERERLLAIHAAIQPLETDTSLNFADPQNVDVLRRQLAVVRRLLPPYSRRYVGRIRS